MNIKYIDFLKNKSQIASEDGFPPTYMPDFLFDFQKVLVDWSVRGGRRALFVDCGMGKTPMQLVWAQNVVERHNLPILILTPLSVSEQTKEEGEKFHIETTRSTNGKFKSVDKIILTNYEKLHYFNPKDFIGVVCDESSIMKNFDGKRKSDIISFMRKTKYRLLCTATASPNDYIELGNSSEALGYMGYMDMLNKFFKNDQESAHPNPLFSGGQWRFKQHAEDDFWRWMCSWARACRKPSDIGGDDENFNLPKLIEQEYFIPSKTKKGFFVSQLKRWQEQKQELRETIEERCVLATDKLKNVDCGIAWCHLNEESKTLKRLIKDSVEVKGSDSDERKEEVFHAFRHKHIRVLITKPKIAAFGMNWQHCSNMTYFPTYSYEQYYQAIRRCWRYGQNENVNVFLITSESLNTLTESIKRKSRLCDKMFEMLVKKMNDPLYFTIQNEEERGINTPTWLIKNKK